MDLAEIVFIYSVAHTTKMIEIGGLLIGFVNYHVLVVFHVSCCTSFSAKGTNKERKEDTEFS